MNIKEIGAWRQPGWWCSSITVRNFPRLINFGQFLIVNEFLRTTLTNEDKRNARTYQKNKAL